MQYNPQEHDSPAHKFIGYFEWWWYRSLAQSYRAAFYLWTFSSFCEWFHATSRDKQRILRDKLISQTAWERMVLHLACFSACGSKHHYFKETTQLSHNFLTTVKARKASESLKIKNQAKHHGQPLQIVADETFQKKEMLTCTAVKFQLAPKDI